MSDGFGALNHLLTLSSVKTHSTIPNNQLAGCIKGIPSMLSKKPRHILDHSMVCNAIAAYVHHSDSLGHVNGAVVMKELHT